MPSQGMYHYIGGEMDLLKTSESLLITVVRVCRHGMPHAPLFGMAGWDFISIHPGRGDYCRLCAVAGLGKTET